ncbi:SseB family protein [Pseudonocardia bannensis]|uniref:SseB family protein n=1 Tax=Pseudonocardia bannensis TaxID=630973 RepID=A0A848DIY0_9PSEU|nr:SseB family protein [Pseudonocardia bannensis]NMH92662.1 SseB family protein [Pseudonocardia bannensis]
MTTSASDDSAPAADAPPGTDQGDTAAVLHDLATSIGLLPQVPPAEGEEQPEGAIALPVIEHDGQRYIPVFTSEDSLRAAGADVGSALRIPIAQLAANWPSDDVWLAVNPASEEGLGLPPDVVRTLPVFAGGGNGAGESTPG